MTIQTRKPEFDGEGPRGVDRPRNTARRRFLIDASTLTTGLAATPYLHSAEFEPKVRVPARTGATGPLVRTRLVVNQRVHEFDLDPRVTLLDALREQLHLTGTKKGCDRGQCGACTVLVNKRRVNSCLSLAVSHDGDEVTTIEGLGTPEMLHPVQAAFVARDAYQCGYCTPGQILSGVALIEEARAGAPSAATSDLRAPGIELSDAEIRERMSGNLCRCGAYVNIVAAIRDAAGRRS